MGLIDRNDFLHANRQAGLGRNEKAHARKPQTFSRRFFRLSHHKFYLDIKMDVAKSIFTNLINTAQTKSECTAIQEQLEALLRDVRDKHGGIILTEERDSLKFRGQGAVSCSSCSNTMDPQEGHFGICDGCEMLFCTECFSECSQCNQNFCDKTCYISFCDSGCESRICSECALECMKCAEAVCSDCAKSVGVMEWKCCQSCVEQWVEDGWHEY